jgi:hypothetical protein
MVQYMYEAKQTRNKRERHGLESTSDLIREAVLIDDQTVNGYIQLPLCFPDSIHYGLHIWQLPGDTVVPDSHQVDGSKLRFRTQNGNERHTLDTRRELDPTSRSPVFGGRVVVCV